MCVEDTFTSYVYVAVRCQLLDGPIRNVRIAKVAP